MIFLFYIICLLFIYFKKQNFNLFYQNPIQKNMQKYDKEMEDDFDDEWNQCIEPNTKNFLNSNNFLNDDSQGFDNLFKRSIHSEIYQSPHQSFSQQLKNLMQTYDQPTSKQQQIRYFIRNPKIVQNIGQQNQINKKDKNYEKSSLYSKNYRQKKKQYVKNLQEENNFLKKKIDQLQMRLRQKQMELNRIKFTSTNQDFSIQKINQDIMTKLSLISNSNDNQQLKGLKTQYITNQKKMQQFVKFYQTYGFGGKKARQLLEYYSNQFLENVMRDRQKYYTLKCMRKKKLVQQKLSLDLALLQQFQQTQEEAKATLRFLQILRPVAIELTNSCKQFYQSYKKVDKLLQRIHGMTKNQYSKDVDVMKKRLKMVMWFQNNQYHKQMRNLRAEWIDIVKSQEQDESLTNNSMKKKIMV